MQKVDQISRKNFKKWMKIVSEKAKKISKNQWKLGENLTKIGKTCKKLIKNYEKKFAKRLKNDLNYEKNYW